MKNQILLAGAMFLVIATMGSCKKEYTCKCSKTYTTGSGSSTNDYSVYTYKDDRVRAEERCNENTSSGSDIWGDYSINCQIQ
ncbi:MAG: hypothetical protein M3Q58_15075 [Bacteroidota bacterium]|nr:hypothetical protein [Bacteroidota bacterium]